MSIIRVTVSDRKFEEITLRLNELIDVEKEIENTRRALEPLGKAFSTQTAELLKNLRDKIVIVGTEKAKLKPIATYADTILRALFNLQLSDYGSKIYFIVNRHVWIELLRKLESATSIDARLTAMLAYVSPISMAVILVYRKILGVTPIRTLLQIAYGLLDQPATVTYIVKRVLREECRQEIEITDEDALYLALAYPTFKLVRELSRITLERYREQIPAINLIYRSNILITTPQSAMNRVINRLREEAVARRPVVNDLENIIDTLIASLR